MANNIVIDFSWDNRRFRYEIVPDPSTAIDGYLRKELANFGCAEPEIVHLLMRALRPGDRAVDGGANIGVFTILMRMLVGDEGRVYAFEPSSYNTWRLEQNLAVNNLLKGVEIWGIPLWSEEVTKEFWHHPSDAGQHSLGKMPDAAMVETVTCTTLDKVPGPFRLIKLDIEGAEEAALQGALYHLNRKVPYIVCEMNPDALALLGSTQESLRTYMAQYGYDTFLLHKHGAYPSQLPLTCKIMPLLQNSNILFSTPEAVAEIWPMTVV